MLAGELDYIVGVDTHLDEHVMAVVAARLQAPWSRDDRSARAHTAIRRRSASPVGTRLDRERGRFRVNGGCAAKTTR
jgi:hypothetical protein